MELDTETASSDKDVPQVTNFDPAEQEKADAPKKRGRKPAKDADKVTPVVRVESKTIHGNIRVDL